jgi:outer membrane receptor protein involved in Fe transport
MSRSSWLLSAGIAALTASPAYAQDNSQPTGQTSPVEQAGEVNPNADVSPTDDGMGDEIVITAQGRTQVLQDVPISVTAISAETMQNSGATDIRQLNQLAPSLLVSSTGSEANGSARIRGIGTVGDNPGLESSVAVFIDGVYRSRSGIGLNELGEIERVEVLRGPQGTLFGRNASAGLINIISKKPNQKEMEGYGEASYGNFDFMRAAAGITGPLGGGLAYRLDGVYVQRDGFLKVANPQNGTESRVNDRDRYFVRGQLSYEASDALSIRLIGDYTKRDESCCGAVFIQTQESRNTTPGSPAGLGIFPNRIVPILTALGETFPSGNDPFNRIISVSPGRTYRNEIEDWGVSGQVDFDLGFGNLTSITAYRDYKAGGAADIDYGRADLVYRDDDGNSFREFQTFSQELRLQGSAFNDRFDWLIGGYYANEDLRVVDNTRFGTQYGTFAACRIVANINPALVSPTSTGCLAAAARPVVAPLLGGAGPASLIFGGLDRLNTLNDRGDLNTQYFQGSENYAVFTHNIFKVTDQLSLTVGLRYTHEKKDFSAEFNNNNTVCPAQQAALAPLLPSALGALAGGIITLTCTGNSSAQLNTLNLNDEFKDGEFTGTSILSYKPNEDSLIYASYSKGYKAGGYNLDRSALGSDPGSNAALFPRTNGDVEDLRFNAEKVDAYEIGAKLSGRGVTFNISAFRQDFKDFQLNTFNGTVFIVQNVNSCGTPLNGLDRDASGITGACGADNVKPGVRAQGLEIELAGSPMRHLRLTGGYTFADTKYRRNLIGSSNGEPLDPALFLLPGDNVSNAPEHVVTGSLTWTPPLGTSGLTGLVYVDTRYSSAYNTGSDLFLEKEQAPFALVNARVGVRGADDRWALEAWAQNLLNRDYQQVAFNAPFQGAGSQSQVIAFGGTGNQIFSSFLAEPRTYGVTGRFRF